MSPRPTDPLRRKLTPNQWTVEAESIKGQRKSRWTELVRPKDPGVLVRGTSHSYPFSGDMFRSRVRVGHTRGGSGVWTSDVRVPARRGLHESLCRPFDSLLDAPVYTRLYFAFRNSSPYRMSSCLVGPKVVLVSPGWHTRTTHPHHLSPREPSIGDRETPSDLSFTKSV